MRTNEAAMQNIRLVQLNIIASREQRSQTTRSQNEVALWYFLASSVRHAGDMLMIRFHLIGNRPDSFHAISDPNHSGLFFSRPSARLRRPIRGALHETNASIVKKARRSPIWLSLFQTGPTTGRWIFEAFGAIAASHRGTSLIIDTGRLFSDFQYTRFSYPNHLQNGGTLLGPLL
jgi:hypothetical protein